MKIHKKFTKPLALICIIAITLTVFSSCTEKFSEFSSSAMGSQITAVFSAEEPEKVSEYFFAMTEAVKKAELELSATDENAEIYMLNKEKLIYASSSLKRSLQEALVICTTLGDSLDFTLGKAVKLWGFSSDSQSVPDSKKLKTAIKNRSLDKISIAAESNKITIEKDIEINLSALAQGIACDRAYNAAKLCDIPYKMSLGNMLMAYGEGPYGGKWEITIQNPFTDNEEVLAKLKLNTFEATKTLFASSSGIYENKFEENGKAYHSILDPVTGYPVENDLASVTVIAESGITAEALSEALFINGFSEKSFSYLKYFSAEAVFIFKDKTYYATEGLKDSLDIADSSFTARTEITN